MNRISIHATGRRNMKGFPNQVAELPKLATAMQCIVRLTDGGQQAKDDGVFGECLVRAGVAGTGHKPIPVARYLRIQRTKTKSGQSFRTTARGLRELFRLLGFIDDTREVMEVKELGRRAAAFADVPIDDEQIRFWRTAIRNMPHDGGDGEESHPYQVLLRFIACRPGLEKQKCALALEAKNDTPEELARISELADLPGDRIRERLRVSRNGKTVSRQNWANAVKILPRFAEQLGDVVRRGGRGAYRYWIADAPGKADAGPPAQPLIGGQGAAVVRAPRSSRHVTPDSIGRAATAEDFDEFAATREVDQARAAESVRGRRDRLRRHNFIVRKLAARFAAAGAELYEDPFDVLALIRNMGILGEVKTLNGTEPDERDRVREALGQLLYYQAFLLPAAAGQASVRMVACFEKRISNEHTEFLNDQNIAVLWQDGDQFAGDALATNFLGRYLEELR